MQYTGNINEKQRRKGQVLDTLQVERERGITVKAQTASMIYDDERTGQRYLINLVDTPGHVDFSYEVSRSLSSCQGALLLVDASQSIQAQTIANHKKAINLGLKIIPVVTKIDLPHAMPIEAALAMEIAFKVDPDDVIQTSAKKNIGIKEVIEAVIDRLPSPEGLLMDKNGPFRGRIVDSWFDEHRGVVCLIQVVSGSLVEGQRITTFASLLEFKDVDNRNDFSVQEVGLLTPEPLRTGSLRTGQVGYVISGMRSTRQARSGDTMYIPTDNLGKTEKNEPLPGYEIVKPMLYASVFPVDSNELENLFAAVDRLCLNDSSISVIKEYSLSLGSGLRCGFLGYLHMEVFNQRLQDEYQMNVIMTTPSVPYRIEYSDGVVEEISNITLWPEADKSKTFKIFEPVVKVVIISPCEYYGALTDIIKFRRGDKIEITYLEDGKTVMIQSIVPWQEVVVDMHDQIKNNSSGYASFNYEDAGFSEEKLVKIEIVVNGDVCEPLSFITHISNSVENGRKIVTKLKEVITRQQFEIIIQAKINMKILAKERIAPYRKDVLSRSGKTVGGGDITRKKKLLEKQKEGKKRSKMVGKVEIGQDAFWAILQR